MTTARKFLLCNGKWRLVRTGTRNSIEAVICQKLATDFVFLIVINDLIRRSQKDFGFTLLLICESSWLVFEQRIPLTPWLLLSDDPNGLTISVDFRLIPSTG